MAQDDVLIDVRAEELRQDQNKFWATAFGVIAFVFAAFQIYTAGAGPYIALMQRAIHVGFAVVLCTIAYRMKAAKEKPQRLVAYLFDLFEIAGAIAVTLYIVWNVDRLILKIGFARPSLTDMVFGYIMAIILIDASRKVIGWAFTWMILAFITYVLLGPWMPGVLAHRGYSPNDLAATLLVNPLGIYGQITGTSANTIAIFMVFGAIMLRTGSAKAFLNVAVTVAGRLTGGGAQVAVLASAMMGSLCGSATATSATVGAFTIPMMKRRGYPGPFAGGVESAASSGGLVTPPVMGAGVFIMAEILGIPYLKIAEMALFPALLYFLGIMMVVHFQAKKQKLGRLSGADMPRLRDYWKELVMLVVPVSVLVTFILQMYTPRFAAFWAVVLNVAVFAVLAVPIGRSLSGQTVGTSFKSTGSTLVAALVEGGGNVATLGVLVAGAQIMVGALGITGLGLKLSQLVISLGITYLFPLLLATMIIACVLGGPLPVVPTYLITAAVTAPLLTPLGLPAVLVHLFIYYYACFSGLTPPVYGPVYSSAVFAEAGVLETGWESMKCAFIGFTVPFVFVYNPAMIGLQGYGAAAKALLIAAAATLVVASAIVGHWNRPLNAVQRCLLAAAGVMIIAPDTTVRIAGFGLGAVLALFLSWQGGEAPAAKRQGRS